MPVWTDNSCPIDTAVTSLLATMAAYPAGQHVLQSSSLDVVPHDKPKVVEIGRTLMQCLFAVYHQQPELLPGCIKAARNAVQGNCKEFHAIESFIQPVISILNHTWVSVSCSCEVHDVTQHHISNLGYLVAPQESTPAAQAAEGAAPAVLMLVDDAMAETIAHDHSADEVTKRQVNPTTVLQESFQNRLNVKCKFQGCDLPAPPVPGIVAEIMFDGPVVLEAAAIQIFSFPVGGERQVQLTWDVAPDCIGLYELVVIAAIKGAHYTCHIWVEGKWRCIIFF